MTEQVLLTVAHAAQTLALSRSKVYELVAGGQLGSVLIGRSRRIPVDAVRSFVEGLGTRNDLPSISA